MRIICPNCDAQYEVPDEVIPPEGRDVQCSNCGTTWMQEHPDHPGAAQVEDAETAAPPDESDAAGTDAQPAADAAAPVAEARPDGKETGAGVQSAEHATAPDEDAAAERSEAQEPAPEAPDAERTAEAAEDDADATRAEDARDDGEEPAPLPRRELDPEVAAILRQEAERETAARAAEARGDGLEIQPDLGLTEGDEAAGRPVDATAGTAEGGRAPTGGGTAADAGAAGATVAGAAAAASRRDVLPDVEEIKSTLRSTGDRDVAGDDRDPEAPGRVRRRRGFRRGLLTAVLIFVVGLLTYQYAPQIAQQAPQADPWLSSYVTWVDETRTTLDRQLRTVLGWLDEQAGAAE